MRSGHDRSWFTTGPVDGLRRTTRRGPRDRTQASRCGATAPRGRPARRLPVGVQPVARGRRRIRVEREGTPATGGRHRPVLEVGRRQFRCVLPTLAHRPEPHLPREGQPRRLGLPVDDGLRRARRRTVQRPHRRHHQRPRAGVRRRRQLRIHHQPDASAGSVAEARTRRGVRADPRLRDGARHRQAGRVDDRGRRSPTAAQRRPRRHDPAAAAQRGPGCTNRLAMLPDEGGAAQRDSRALPGADPDLRLGRRRCRVRHGRLRARPRPGARRRGHVAGVRVLEPLPVESLPAHLRLHQRARHHQRRRGHLRGGRILAHRDQRPGPRPSELGVHRRPSQGPDLAALVPAGSRHPRVRTVAW